MINYHGINLIISDRLTELVSIENHTIKPQHLTQAHYESIDECHQNTIHYYNHFYL